MSHDHNSKRDERLRNVPAPKFRRDPELELSEFEDQSLVSSLKVMAISKDDGVDFLQHVTSRLGSSAATAAATASGFNNNGDDSSFFGVASPSFGDLADSKPEAVAAEPKPRGKNRHAVAIAIASAAAMLVFGLVVWKTAFHSNPTDGPELHASTTPRNDSEEDVPFVTPRESTDVEISHHEKKTVTSEALTIEVEDPKTEAIASSPSSHPVKPKAISIEPLWHLHFEFDRSQTATVWVGKHRIRSGVPMKGSDATFKCICHEVAKHVHFYSPILEPAWQGKLTISGPDFRIEESFSGIDEMVDARMQVRNSFLEHVSKSEQQPTSNTDAVEYHLHEGILKSALTVADQIVQRGLNPSIFKEPDSVLYKNFAHLTESDLSSAADSASPIVAKRDANVLFGELVGFQTRSTPQLKLDLQRTTQFDMFEDINESNEWIEQIANATEKNRLALKIKQLTERTKKLKKSLQYASDRSVGYKLEREIQQLGGEIAQRRRFMETASSEPARSWKAPLFSLLGEKSALRGFNIAMGDECHLCESDAETLDQVSDRFGRVLQQFDRFASRDFSRKDRGRVEMIQRKVRKLVSHDNPDQAIGTIDQMLQIERSEIRLTLVETLAQMDTQAACRLLACYAKFDIEPEVRMAAADALRSFPPEMCRAELLEGFSYPWPDAAKHAAEALVRLNDTDSVPALVELLKQPDPRLPKEVDDGVFERREMVAINHLRNCLLCHQDSHNADDKGRGVIPVWNKDLEALYYRSKNPELANVRADVTYLRQDFSIVQEVEKSGRWPKHQRFDYVARDKTVSSSEAKRIRDKLSSQPNEYRTAIATALRLLTDKSPANDSWKTWASAVEDIQ